MKSRPEFYLYVVGSEELTTVVDYFPSDFHHSEAVL